MMRAYVVALVSAATFLSAATSLTACGSDDGEDEGTAARRPSRPGSKGGSGGKGGKGGSSTSRGGAAGTSAGTGGSGESGNTATGGNGTAGTMGNGVCGTLTFDGECKGTLLRVCDNGVIHEEDCALSDQICLTDANGSSDCAPDPNPGTGGKGGAGTGGVGAGGAGDGGNGGAGAGTGGSSGAAGGGAAGTSGKGGSGAGAGTGGSSAGTSGSSAGAGGSSAGTGGSSAGTGGSGGAGTGGSTTNNCGAVTYEGSCAGDVLQFCDGQNVVTIDCFAEDPLQTCAFITEASLYDCTYGCGNVTFDGECKGSVLRWCEDAQINSYDCSLDSQTCGADGNSTFYVCK
jgi:hypothetical protein